MNQYEQELSTLKPYDPIQFSSEVEGYQFITTNGHGYLVVKKDDKDYGKALKADTGYGFKGSKAIYLEEDCEMHNFLISLINEL